MPPVLSVSPALVHPWVNSQMLLVGHEKLQKWDSYASVGKILKEVEQEFMIRPPILSLSPSKPEFPFDFSQLEAKSTSFLEELVSDEIKLFEYLQGTQDVRNIHEKEEKIMEENENLARSILQSKGELDKLHEILLKLHSEYNQIRMDYEALYDLYQIQLSKLSADTVISRFNNDILRLEDSCDIAVNDFLSSSTQVDSFLKEFLLLRSNYYKLSLKLEILKESKSKIFSSK